VERIINEVTEKLKREFREFFAGKDTAIAAAEAYFSSRIAEATLELLRCYYEKMDRELREDKAGRKRAGITVERRGDKREILLLLGPLEYRRTYYKKASGGYEYPVDRLAGVEAYERVSEGVGLSLVEASREMSYGKASAYAAGKQVSRQTVMNKLRKASPKQGPVEYRAVSELHIDADEDHVNLQDGSSTIVPLISVYEGIEHQGKRGVCKNVFHISEYGKSPSALWEQVSDELERRYDLTQARIYLHGDGAPWIRQGLDYLPNCKFVLDRYHKNKAIKQALSGIDRLAGSQHEHQIRKALDAGDKERLLAIRSTLLSRYPNREKTIQENLDYLLNNFEAITITQRDKASLNGGCTEPHVSHVLSSRLSSRPMGWSDATLTRFVPILAAGSATFSEPEEQEERDYPPASAFLTNRKKRFLPGTLGLADPDNAVMFPARANKVTPLFNALRPF
jgi:hypothetical protein